MTLVGKKIGLVRGPGSHDTLSQMLLINQKKKMMNENWSLDLPTWRSLTTFESTIPMEINKVLLIYL